MTAPASWYAIQGPNGDLSWRVASPAKAIGAKVVMIPEASGADAVFWPNLDTPFPWIAIGELTDGRTVQIETKDQWLQLASTEKQLLNTRTDYPAHEGGSAIFCRPLAWLAAHMMELRQQHGVRVLAEVDDNYLSPQRANIFMQMGGWSEDDRDNHIRSVAVGDGLIVSTKFLRDLYYKGFRKEFGKKLVPDIFVCRNHVDEDLIPEPLPKRTDGRLRVGYMGSDSHIWDVDLIYDALLYAHDVGHEIVFVGIGPEFINPKWQRAKHNWKALEATHIPWRNEGFRGTALPLDIGLAPLLVDKHTLGKSDIKWLEYGLSGAACVAQNCEVFNRTAVHGEHALLAGSPAEFLAATKQLIRDATLRDRLVANTNQYIQEERLLSKNANEWREAIFG